MRNLLIFGSGRSGTSLAAGVLSEVDYHQGTHLLDADEANPKGYFEDRQLNLLNEDILDPLVQDQPLGILGEMIFPRRLKYGRRWIADIPLEAEIPRPDGAAARIREYTRRTPFCYKDPRFSYTLPVWEPHLPDDTGYVVVFRDPLVTAKSIDKETDRVYPRLEFPLERGLEVWTAIYSHVLDRHVPEGGDWLFVHFDQFFDGTAVRRLSEFAGVELSGSFVDEDLRRTRTPDDVDVPLAVEELYHSLCKRAGHAPAQPGGAQ